jgi:hypothetical protein
LWRALLLKDTKRVSAAKSQGQSSTRCWPDIAQRAEDEEKPFFEQLLQEGARKLLQAAIENEVIDYIQFHKDRRDEHGQRLVVGNGHLPYAQPDRAWIRLFKHPLKCHVQRQNLGPFRAKTCLAYVLVRMIVGPQYLIVR